MLEEAEGEKLKSITNTNKVKNKICIQCKKPVADLRKKNEFVRCDKCSKVEHNECAQINDHDKSKKFICLECKPAVTKTNKTIITCAVN